MAIILAFACFILLATFPGWHEEIDEHGSDRDVKPFPSRPVSQIALALIFVASVFVLVSVLWQHTASVAASTIAQDLGNGSVKSGVGTAAMILGWFGFALLIIVTIGESRAHSDFFPWTEVLWKYCTLRARMTLTLPQVCL